MKRVVAKTADGWQLGMSEPLSAIAPQEEPDMLTEYLREIRYPYRKVKSRFVFPAGIRESDIFEVLQHFYDCAAEVEVEGWKSKRLAKRPNKSPEPTPTAVTPRAKE
jgi:hypothetical protein